VERSVLAKRFFIARWERERAEGGREGGRGRERDTCKGMPPVTYFLQATPTPNF
jgi:hypothetical protein